MSTDTEILVVDDRPQDLLAIEGILSTRDYRLSTANTCAQALRRLLEREFAVILLDVMMPDMDGFELAAIIKQRDRSRHTPIIFMTSAGTDMSFIYRAYSAGAVDYLAKPIDADVLQAKVAIFVDLFRKDQRIKAQAEALRLADRRERDLEATELRIANQRRYRNLADAIPQIVWTRDSLGVVTYLNQQWFEYTGQEAAEALGDGWQRAVHADDLAGYLAHWRTAVAGTEVFEHELRLRRADGELRWHLCRAVPERDAQGGVIGWLGTDADFDDRKRALDEAHAAVSARDEFLSIASHELRTPLTALEMSLHGLESNLAGVIDSGRDDVRRKLSIAKRSSGRLVALVDSLLDVTRITNGRLTLQRTTFDFGDTVRAGSEGLAAMARAAGCDVAVTTGGDLIGHWDRLRLEQVVENLLGNAIRYAPRAPIEVDVLGRVDSVMLSICDHGMGIDAIDVERVFGRFERAVSERSHSGLGMGLYITRQIATAHGGSIRAISTPSAGSTFVVELPRG